MKFINNERLITYPIIIFVISWATYFAVTFSGAGLTDGFGKTIGADFICFYSASSMLQDGAAADVYDIKKLMTKEASISKKEDYDFASAWFYPPIYLLFIKKLASVSYLQALLLFTLVTFAMYFLSMALLLPNRLSYLWLITFPGVFQNITNGQNGFLSATILTCSLYFIDKKPFIAGLILGIMSYKPHLAFVPFLILLATMNYKALYGCALSSATLVIVSILSFGFAPWSSFLHTLPLADTLAVSGFLPWYKMNSPQAGFLLLGMTPEHARLLHIAIALGAIAFTAMLWRQKASFNLRASALIITTLLSVPFGYDYDLAMLAPALIWFGLEAWKSGWSTYEKSIIIVAWIVPILSPPLALATNILLTPLVLIMLLVAIRNRYKVELQEASLVS